MQTFGILHTISLLARVSSPTPFHEPCEPRLGISAWRSLLHYLDPCPVASFQAHARRDTALRGESKAPIISRSRMSSRTSQNEVSMMMARAKCGPSPSTYCTCRVCRCVELGANWMMDDSVSTLRSHASIRHTHHNSRHVSKMIL